jgi:hypothetical protein
MGFLAELLVRTYYESQHKTPYAVKHSLNLNPGVNAQGQRAADARD